MESYKNLRHEKRAIVRTQIKSGTPRNKIAGEGNLKAHFH